MGPRVRRHTARHTHDLARAPMKRELEGADEELEVKRPATGDAAATLEATAEQEPVPAPLLTSETAVAAVAETAEETGAVPALSEPVPLTGSAALAAMLAANPALVDGPQSMIAFDANALDVNFKLELHCDAVVAVFGYDGLTITTIRERTNCRMRLLDAGIDPNNRVFEMMGSQVCT